MVDPESTVHPAASDSAEAGDTTAVVGAKTLDAALAGGLGGLAGSEIGAFDPNTDLLFVTDGGTGLQVIDLSDPTAPTLATTIDLSAFGAGANSVAVDGAGLVAVAVEAETVTDPGTLVLFQASEALSGAPSFGSTTVGALPDAVTVVEDGEFIVANEGEPDEGVDPEGTISIVTVTDLATIAVETADFSGFDTDALRAEGVRIFPGNSFAADAEPEFIAVSEDASTAFVTLQENNAVAVVDIATATVTEIQPLGLKDYALPGDEIDPSDEDGVIDFRSVPAFGLYQPDAIASYTVGGDIFYVTANEGDARDEDARIADVLLDPTAFPDAATLQDEADLGRLEISTIDGDLDGDGDFDQLVSYGGRSFSIRDVDGAILFDSANELGRIAADLGLYDDGRSDAKGVEPEGVTIGEIDGAIYAFIGLERPTSTVIAVYDVSNPAAPVFDQALTSSSLSPEGLVFVSAEDSPNGAPLLLVTNEVSGNLDVFTLGAASASGMTPVFEIQGASQVSPLVLNGQSTADFFANLPEDTLSISGGDVSTAGLVTGIDSGGFYLQDPIGDGDDATSDAVFVFTGFGAPILSDLAVGDAVSVDGTVSEFFPGDTDARNLPTTQLTDVSVTIESRGEDLPEPVIIGATGRVPPTEIIDDDAFASFDPATDGIDFFESLEGMLVTATDLVAVAGTNQFGEIFAVTDQGAGATGLSERGTLNISPDDFNPEKIQIDEDSGVFNFDFPSVNVGDQLGDVTGIIGYSFGNFEIIPTVDFTPNIVSAGLAPESTDIVGAEDLLTVASYNLLNLDPVIEDPALTDDGADDVDDDVGDGRFDAIAAQIVDNLNAPDVIGLQEVQDNSGAEINGVVAADQTLQTLVDAIAAAGGPTYAFIDNSFIADEASGGQPGGNIRTAFLYNPDRVELDAASVQTIDGQGAGEAFEGARLPLVADFAFNGETVTVVNNHFSSKGGSAPILGVEQPFEARQEEVAVNGSLDERQAQSAAVQGFVSDILADDPDANLVVLGDFNEFEFVSPVTGLESVGLANLTNSLPEDERYSFLFQGNSQSLDHILVSDSLASGAAFDVVAVNSEFANTPSRASDHDPLVAALQLSETPAMPTIFEIARDNENFDILEAALLATGLDAAVADPAANLTVFAPTDAAFITLAETLGLDTAGLDDAGVANAIVAALTDFAGSPEAGLDLLSDLLLYHVTPGALSLADLQAAGTVETALTGESFTVNGTTLIDNEPDAADPNFVAGLTDLPADNGVVHVIDAVLLPDDAIVEPTSSGTFTLELLHAADQEAGALAVQDAPNFSAVLNALRDEDLGDDGVADNTLTLSSGDAFIPGLFYDASNEVFGSGGIADIAIQNELGFQAIALGNHEFDFGPRELSELITGLDVTDDSDPEDGFVDTVPQEIDNAAIDFSGADFPYLSSNLDFSTDPFLAPLAVEGGQAPQANSVTSSVVIDVNGEPIGVVGATTPTLASIASPGGVGISPSPFDANPTPEQLDALAAEIQAEVDALLAADPTLNKIVLLSHMQQLDIERELAARLEHVDIIVGGGSNTRLFDENDVPRAGDSVQGEYPEFIANAGGTQTALVNTDGSYKYVGRLVIDFDANGDIIPESYDPDVSGAYATDDAGVAALGAEGLIDPEIQAIADAIEAQIIATEGNVLGVSDVFLNANRSGVDADPTDPDGVRTQETNLGNLTADANLAIAKESDPEVVISLKNGGGIRANIGQSIVPAGGTDEVRIPTEEVLDSDGALVKPEGGVSQNDIQTTLAFNNGLTLLTLTKEEIIDLLEHGVGAIPDVSGRFPQVSGVKFSYDPDLPEGDRILSAGVFDENDALVTELVRDGEIVGDPNEEFRIVTLDFLASPRFDDNGVFIGGGDGYPFPNTDDPAVAARVNPVALEQEGVTTGDATFADDGTEQDALAEFLLDNFADESTAFNEADTGRDLDERIQNLNFRSDSVLPGGSEPDDLLEFALIDAKTDQTILTIEEGQTILRSQIDGLSLTIGVTVPEDSAFFGAVESAVLDLNGTFTRTEQSEAYSVFGNRGDDFRGRRDALENGENTLSLDLFSEDFAGGDLVGEVSRSFTVVDDRNALPAGLTVLLIDADTGATLDTIENNKTLDIDETANLTIGVEIDETVFEFAETESVRLNLNQGEAVRTENSELYTLFGDRDGEFSGGQLALGEQSLKLSFFDEDDRQGQKLDDAEIVFTFV